MAEELKVPQTGYEDTQATLVEWLKEEGDAVAREENIVVLETQKSSVELPCPADGYLRKILAEKGDEVVMGQTLAIIGGKDEDIEELVNSITASAAGGGETATSAAAASDSKPVPAASDAVEIIPLTGVRKAMADNMLKSKQTSAHGTTFNEADLTQALVAVKASGKRISVTALIVKAVVDALKEFPLLNASSSDTEIRLKKYYNISMAVNTDRGLFTPVIKQADLKSLEEINEEMTRLGDLAEKGKLSSGDMEDGTFTISNAGRFGSLFFVPIINQPQSAILGIGTIAKRPVALNDQIEIRPMAYICVSYDHRIIPGAIAQQFLVKVKHGIEEIC
ncbi:MAG: 2-oxo acid dehydrogenase subunit E2 [Deltaproteobacteria bacterium]|nr:2-oxo acid dehydrogenase subunit E2 [Deltaproteobacteria bacterium]